VETIEILRKARALIAQGYVRHIRRIDDLDGRTRFCALGAVDAAVGGGMACGDWSPAVSALSHAIPEGSEEALVGYNSLWEPGRVANYNNNTDQARTVAMFDRAIAKLEAELFMTKLKDSLKPEVVKEISDVCV
jgi:hypothetical protein